MKNSATGWLLAAALLAAGCAGGNEGGANAHANAGGASSGTAGGGTAGAAAITPVPIVPLRVEAGEAPDGGPAHVVELRADGGLYADGELHARFDGRVVTDEHGAELYRIAPDGAITTPHDQSGRARLTQNGEIVTADSRIVVGEDGSVEERHNDGRVDRAPIRLAGMTAAGRRAGAVMTLWMFTAQATPAPAPPAQVAEVGPATEPGAGLDGGASADASADAAPHDAGRRRRR